MKKIVLLSMLTSLSVMLASELNNNPTNTNSVKGVEQKAQDEKESRIKKIIDESEAKKAKIDNSNPVDLDPDIQKMDEEDRVKRMEAERLEREERKKRDDIERSEREKQKNDKLNPSNNQSQDLDSLNEQMKVLIKSVNEIKESKTKFESVEKALLKNNKFIENNQETNDNATAPLAEIIDIDELNKYFLPDPIKLIKIGNTSFVYGEYKEKGYEVVNETLTEGFIPKTIRMKEGFTIGNWVLEEIDSDHVIYGNKKTKEKVIKYYDASKDGKKSIIIPSNGKGSKKDQVSVQKPAEQKDTKNPTNLKDKKIESKKQ